jgi:hypothetical protein
MDTWIDAVRETWIVVGIIAPLFGLFIWAAGKKGMHRPITQAVLQTIGWAALMSMIGTLQRLSDKGMIAATLKWFLIGALLLSLSAQAIQAQLARKNKKPPEDSK